MAPPYPKISTILRMNPATSTSRCSASMGPKRIPSVTGLTYLNILRNISEIKNLVNIIFKTLGSDKVQKKIKGVSGSFNKLKRDSYFSSVYFKPLTPEQTDEGILRKENCYLCYNLSNESKRGIQQST